MTRRTLQNYLGVNTHSGNANNRFATTAVKKNKLPQPEKKTVYNSLKNFFQNNIIAWFIHDWRVKKPYNYPTQITARSVHTVADEQTGKPVTIAIAADWGSDTPQSEFIGMKISEKDPDYTIHLGDTYYSGVESELNANYGTGGDDEGIWPRGSKGAFILAGNHEMFSSGCDFYKMIQDEQRRFGIKDQVSGVYMGQEAACFCLLTPWWCILGLDTGYNSLKTGILHLSPNNTGLQLPDALIKWLTEEVKPSAQHKGLIILSHHQYMSAFNGEDEFPNPAKQLQTIF
ncbi:MAG TPA: hypothetical protein VNS32_10725, partial [Flavisolibacter sp.]|nr:hypothetical protein [Flavisolibacter sp.]